MTNKELIQLLSKYPEEAEVHYYHLKYCGPITGYISDDEIINEVYLDKEKDILIIW